MNVRNGSPGEGRGYCGAQPIRSASCSPPEASHRPEKPGYAASIGVTRLEAHVAPDNHASRRVAEAAGFTQADTFTDGDGTEFIRYTRDASGDGAAPLTK
jgi:hypothetical protein